MKSGFYRTLSDFKASIREKNRNFMFIIYALFALQKHSKLNSVQIYEVFDPYYLQKLICWHVCENLIFFMSVDRKFCPLGATQNPQKCHICAQKFLFLKKYFEACLWGIFDGKIVFELHWSQLMLFSGYLRKIKIFDFFDIKVSK